MKIDGIRGWRWGCCWLGLLAWGATEEGLTAKEKQTEAERDFIVQLQVYLDRAGFPPGKIDGEPGEFTAKALANLIQARGWRDGLGAEFLKEWAAVDPVYVEYEVRDRDRKFIGSVPGSKSAQARAGRMPYRSLKELVCERFHASDVLVAALNPKVNLARLKAGDRVRVPNVEPFEIERLRATIENQPPTPPLRLLGTRLDVSLKDRIVRVYGPDDQLIAAFPTTPGSSSPGMRTPKGDWKVANVVIFPNFRYDRSMLKTGKRSNQFYMIPPGPNNPVGVAWIGLNRSGIGLHGTNEPRTIGRAVSHGCMRLANWDAVRLYQHVQPGVPVVIGD